MKKTYVSLIFMALSLFGLNMVKAQNTLTVNFSDMTPHIGQELHLRVVNLADMSEVGRINKLIKTDTFKVSLKGIAPGKSYHVDIYVDLNKNGKYDPPPADHAWRLILKNVTGNEKLNFVHNTNFTDIKWP